MRVLVFDTETSGLPPRGFNNKVSITNVNLWPYIVQFSYVIYNTKLNSIEKLEDMIIKVPPHVKLNGESEKIHGITDEMNKTRGIPIEMALKKFTSDIEHVDSVVGHNLDFDMNMVRAEWFRLISNKEKAHRINDIYVTFLTNLKEKKCICTMQTNIERCNIKATSAKGKEYTKWPTLAELHKHLYDCAPANLHNSLIDVIACLRCYIAIISDVDVLRKCNIAREVMGDAILIETEDGCV